MIIWAFLNPNHVLAGTPSAPIIGDMGDSPKVRRTLQVCLRFGFCLRGFTTFRPLRVRSERHKAVCVVVTLLPPAYRAPTHLMQTLLQMQNLGLKTVSTLNYLPTSDFMASALLSHLGIGLRHLFSLQAGNPAGELPQPYRPHDPIQTLPHCRPGRHTRENSLLLLHQKTNSNIS